MDTLGEIRAPASPPEACAPPLAARPGSDAVSILARLDAIVYDWDVATDRLTWGPNVEQTLLGVPREALQSGAEFAGMITSDSESSRFHAVQNGLGRDDGQGVPFRVAYRLALPDASILSVEDFGRWFADAEGRPCKVHGVLRILSRDIGAPPELGALSMAAAEEIMCTRRAFNETVDARCGAARPAEAPFAVLIIGVKNLAAVNRQDGYDAADELIASVGRRMAKYLRGGDKVVRYSGGKFAILMSVANADQLPVAALRLSRVLGGDAYPISSGALKASVCVGAALAPRHGRNAHLLLQRADEAYEQAEGSGEPYVVFEPDQAISELRRREARVADEIIAALNERRVVLAFQPIVPTVAGRSGFEEALLRVRQDDGGLLGPEVLLPVAEKLGLIEQVDQRVLELTVEQLARNPIRRLSMNVSVASLRAPDWLDRLGAVLKTSPGAAERLIVEIVETQAIDDVHATVDIIRRMKALGVRIAMDDFGAGHTSFRNLRNLGVDIVKIDGAFVQNLARSVDDRFFVRTLASLARHLGIETVAEWVEDAEAMRLLTEWGIDYLQGHWIGRAEAPEPSAADAPRARVGA